MRAGPPSEGGFARGVHAEHCDSLITTKWRSVQREAADAKIPGDEDGRIRSGVTVRHLDRAIDLFEEAGESAAFAALLTRVHRTQIDLLRDALDD